MFWLLISATACWNSSSTNLQEIYVAKVLFSQKSPAWQSKRMVSLLKYPLTCQEGTIVMPLGILSSRGRLCVHLVSLWWVGRGLVIVQATREPSSVRWLWTGLQSRVTGREGGMGRRGLPRYKSFTTTLLKITQVRVPRTVVLLHTVIAYQSSCITLGKISPFVVSSILESFSKYKERLAYL